MTGQQLRNSILQEAIQGRLVPNVLLPGEKTGAELLQGILAERQQKENDEKGKKAKRLSLSIIEDEPWELPDGWCWCSLEDFCTITAGQSPEGSDINGQEGVEFHQGKIYFGELYLKEANIYTKRITKIAHKDSVLLCMRAPVGIVNITPREICIGRGLSSIECYAPISSLFLCYWLRSYKDYFEDRATGSTFKAITGEIVKHTPIPLPPLSIQKAIVSKIEELFLLVDEYEKASVELNTLNEFLPDKLRKSVLQEAIHGNLVSNDIPEGEATAPELLQQILKKRQEKENKEKGKKTEKLTLSIIDEEPFMLPDGWCWCRIGDVADIERGGNFAKSDFVEKGYPCIHYGQIHMKFGPRTYSVLSYLSNELATKQRKAHTGDIIMAVTSENIEDVCKCTAWLGESDVVIGAHTAIIRHYIDPVFLVYYFKSSLFYSQKKELGHGSKVVEVTPASLYNVILPLPPLSIQHRIVEKIEAVFAAIDKLQE